MSAPRTVLLVEDDPRLQRLVKMTLESDGYRVVPVGDGQSALRAFADERPDLIILDLILPGEIDGYDICKTIRSISAIPIIMLTSRARESDKIAGFDAGADDYVTKPFSCPELRARVKAVVNRSLSQQEQSSCKYCVGDLEIDFIQRRVRRSGREIDLTQTEYRVLEYLARNPGKVLLHDEILTAVWGTEYRDEYQYIRNYISNLRKKIEPDPSNPRYILSKPGIGYCLADS